MIYKFDKLDSTNKYAMENADMFSNFDVVVCENQTAGYGVTGAWENKVGNLFYTIIIENESVDIKKLPFMILNSMHKLLSEFIKVVHIKLPNDLYIGDKKIGGFIIEKKENKYIVGIGINVNKQVKEHISMKDILNYDLNLDDMIIRLTQYINFEITYDDVEVLKYFNSATNIVGNNICYIDKKSKTEYEDLCLSIDFDNIYFKKNTIDIKKFTRIIEL